MLNKLKSTVFNFIDKRINTLGYMPRWIILLIDLLIVLFSTVLTFVLLYSFNNRYFESINIPFIVLLILIVNTVFFVFYKTYSGIIRHSTFIDGSKLLVATLWSFAVLAAYNYSWAFFYQGKKIFITSGFFIDHALIFIFLFLFRIAVKGVFEMFLNIKNDQKLLKVIIYGTDANALSVAKSLKTEVPKRFSLVGFIDNVGQNNSSKSILNVPIYNHVKPLNEILKVINANALIVTEKNLSNADKIAIVEECLENNIKVFTIPQITDWQDSKQISNQISSFNIEDLLERSPIVLATDKISKQLEGKTILITGAAGSIGSEITRQIIKFAPKKIIVLDQAETPLHDLRLELEKLKLNIKIRNVLVDIRDYQALEKIFEVYKPEMVYHAAAYKHVPIIEDNPAQAVYTNIIGTKNLADLSQKYGIERFVMVSTDKAVNPSNVMGASKRIAEMYVQSLSKNKNNQETKFQTKFMTTRFGNVLGSNGSIVPLFTKQILEGGPITITHPEIIRYFMTIPEACQLVLEAGTMGNGGEIFIFDMGKPVKIIDLAHKMIKLAGFVPEKDIKIQIIGLRPGEKLYEELLNDTSKTLPTYNPKIVIAEDKLVDFEAIKSSILELEQTSKSISNIKIVGKMKAIVPEFKSMNSVFEDLDSNFSAN